MLCSDQPFQVFAKPVGARCNLSCTYCYYLSTQTLAGQGAAACMSDTLLERYICPHIELCKDSVIQFSWHGGEPTLFGLEGFRRIVALQKKHCPEGRRIVNGIQTNGTLLDEAWCEFLAQEGFAVGLSLDGPGVFHDQHRVTAKGQPTCGEVLDAYERLQTHGIATEILCVVNAFNAGHATEVYDFFRQLDVKFLTFLPLVEPVLGGGVSDRTVPAEAWGEFLCTIFDLWQARDIGRIKVQIFEEALRAAFGLEHSLCI
ncbi:MAG: radical SAM protein, partial [Phycisphaeraceae bacterium]|nr:radical SAM protein [Phycisphaeraceae bacterium]